VCEIKNWPRSHVSVKIILKIFIDMLYNLTAICEPIVLKMWEPRRLTTLWAFMACYRDSFTFLYIERQIFSNSVEYNINSTVKKIIVFCDVTPCSQIYTYRRLRELLASRFSVEQIRHRQKVPLKYRQISNEISTASHPQE
jgi:hypothetical protein